MTVSFQFRPLRRAAISVAGAGALLAAAAAIAQTPPAAPSGAQPAAMHRMHPGMGMGAGMGMGMGMPMVPERMLDAVGASAEQKTRLRDIFKAAGDDMRTQHESARDLHGQMGKLMAAPQVDAAAAETLRQKQLAVHDTVSKRMLQAMLDAQAVLTPEQRAKLAERMAARRDHMQHRMDRHDHGAPQAPKS
jgi:Spy/CpxP family protein refolding chaperone